MSADEIDSRFTNVLLHPVFVLCVFLAILVAYVVVVVQRPGPLIWLATSLGVTALGLWLLYRLVVAVEDLSSTVRRIEASLDRERESGPVLEDE